MKLESNYIHTTNNNQGLRLNLKSTSDLFKMRQDFEALPRVPTASVSTRKNSCTDGNVFTDKSFTFVNALEKCSLIASVK